MQFSVSITHDVPGPVPLPQFTSGIWLITTQWHVDVDAGASGATATLSLKLGTYAPGVSASATAGMNSSTEDFFFAALTQVDIGNPRLELSFPPGVVAASGRIRICAEKVGP